MSAVEAVTSAYERIAADGRPGIWIELVDRDRALGAAAVVDADQARGESRPLRGVTVAVKGNIDVAGHRTTAGCPVYGEVATVDAPSVAALEAAGAVVVGITVLDQFATGLDGTRTPQGPCPNAHWPHLISGGSSSGSGVAVAAGLVDIGLGTDTAGSGRVPAAANGIVGLKPTRAAVSRAGIVPACWSLDSVAVLARTVHEAAAVARVMRATAPDPADPWNRSWPAASVSGSTDERRVRVGVADPDSLDFDGDPSGPADYRLSLDALEAAGGELTTVDVSELLAAGRLLYGGSFVAERFASVGPFVVEHPDDVHPVVGGIIAASGDLAGWEVFRDMAELERIRQRTSPMWSDVDVLALPTVPRIPTLAAALADQVAASVMLGRFTNFVNLLDLCALAVPVGPPGVDRPPASVSLVAPAWADDLLVDVGARVTGVPVAS